MQTYSRVKAARKTAYKKINAEIFRFNMVKPPICEWAERTIILPEGTTRFPGLLDMDLTPYWREVLGHGHPSSPTRTVSVMKGSQSGFTANVLIPLICYIISENPDPILFTASDQAMAAKTIAERLDPILMASHLAYLIRPNVIKKGNGPTGDTKLEKQFAGGALTARGTNNPDSFRMFSAKYVFADDWDTAPQKVGKEGSPKGLIQGRQTSYGDSALTIFGSTPTDILTSQILKQYLLGTQKKWNWPCPHCGEFMVMDWRIDLGDEKFAGIVWELDRYKKLIKDSIFFKCPHCEKLVSERDKYDLNKAGIWVSGVEHPIEDLHESYSINGLIIPPGFTNWTTLVQEFLAACPPGEKTKINDLINFKNQRLGQPSEESGEAPRVTELMKNTRNYQPGIIPDVTCASDGNGRIIMLTLACDINGWYKSDLEDVRLDYELVAHTSNGVTYSVDHGSIGTFKRNVHKTKEERDEDGARVKWTITHGVQNSVWKPFEEVIRKIYPLESELLKTGIPANGESKGAGGGMSVNITVCDTGMGNAQVMQFVQSFDDIFIFGIKGRVEKNYRAIIRDTQPIKRSSEKPRHLYIAEVNQIKDDLAGYMQLREGEDGSFPPGYMNFPQPRDDKYIMKTFFNQYESERRVEEVQNGTVVGYKWEKKNNDVQNHFWDVRVYNLAAPLIYLDIFKQSNPSKYKNYTWEDFVALITG